MMNEHTQHKHWRQGVAGTPPWVSSLVSGKFKHFKVCIKSHQTTLQVITRHESDALTTDTTTLTSQSLHMQTQLL
jgi:hypothetical protein